MPTRALRPGATSGTSTADFRPKNTDAGIQPVLSNILHTPYENRHQSYGQMYRITLMQKIIKGGYIQAHPDLETLAQDPTQ